MSHLRKIGLAGLFVLSTLAPAAAAGPKTLIVAEPSHNIGYLPLYVAIHNGYFASDGLDVKMMSARQRFRACGCGPERSGLRLHRRS